jgi:hypothetical protein
MAKKDTPKSNPWLILGIVIGSLVFIGAVGYVMFTHYFVKVDSVSLTEVASGKTEIIADTAKGLVDIEIAPSIPPQDVLDTTVSSLSSSSEINEALKNSTNELQNMITSFRQRAGQL